MCEVCGPSDGTIERVSPELMVKLREINQREANRRGISLEKFLEANVTVSPLNRFRAWLENAWLNFQLLKPSL